MKLQHKIAGTILLPLAAATMATTANAAGIEAHGFVESQFNMLATDNNGTKTSDVTGSALNSRLSLKFTELNDAGASVLFEGDFNDATTPGVFRARHAVVMVDGWSVGQTWSPSANLNGLMTTIDDTGLAAGSAPAGRTPQISKTLDVGVGTLKAGIEDRGLGKANKDGPSIPDISAGLTMKMDALTIFAAAALENAQKTADSKNQSNVEITASANMDLGGGMKVVGSFVQSGDKKTGDGVTGFSGGLGMDLGGGISANGMYEIMSYDKDGAKDQSTLIANAFYKMPNGLRFGAEYKMLENAKGANKDNSNTVSFEGQFAF